ncbi:MAG: hypothetical protein KatS3mg061_2592 [Dehalococcoidia bacterium]|nr:MAG: hypothetical protein KatS3mg061_2592 [Dehalococcoidia bacterium]
MAAEQDPPRTGNPFAAGLIALAIVVACILPPILHFVTGPLGPFIGGLVAGSRVSGRPRELAIIALTVGVGLALFTGGIGGLWVAVASSLPAASAPTLSWPVLAEVSAGLLVYGALLAGLGAALAARLKRRSPA